MPVLKIADGALELDSGLPKAVVSRQSPTMSCTLMKMGICPVQCPVSSVQASAAAISDLLTGRPACAVLPFSGQKEMLQLQKGTCPR